jgi:hypothetical protein
VSQESAKKLVRTPWVQSALAWLVSIYLAVTLATMRWRYENREVADAAVAAPGGLIACFWHGRIALAPVLGRVLKGKPRRALISNSPDGELIAKVMARLGFPAIRGSTTQDNRAPRRSVEAFRDAVRFIESGGAMGVTPDGPRGPAEQMPAGPVAMSRIRETPVYLLGLAAHPALTLRSWDRMRIPLPFSRGCLVVDGPHRVARNASSAAVRSVQAEWQARLNAAQARAEARVGAR